MKPLREVLMNARAAKRAVGHFNVSDLAGVRAIIESAQALEVPVMIGVSEGERDFIGIREIAWLAKGFRSELGIPVYLNADHTHDLLALEPVARAGFDEILFDGSKLPFEENVRKTKQAVEIIKSVNPEIVVEGEIGYIGSSSAILDERPEGAVLLEKDLTTPEEARQFVEETKIDVLAPAVGNMHGLLKSMVEGKEEKHLNLERIAAIAGATPAYLTLHGGSGTADADFSAAIERGITIIHVNTEIRLAWRKGVEEGLAANPNEIAPYKLLPPAVRKIRDIVEDRLRLFSRMR